MTDNRIKSLENEILRLLLKAPKGKRGARGNLVHLQDPDFTTDDAQLLMTRPTMGMTQLIEKVLRKHEGSRKNVTNSINYLVDKHIVCVSKSRKFQDVPTLIPIKYEKDYRTQKIGTYKDGQYAGFDFWIGRNMSVLHLFDKFGFHVNSQAWDSETGCDPVLELDNAIQALFRPYPGDISVQLFSLQLLGIEFGLLKTRKDHVEYVPLMLGFNSPWNGCYDT